MFDEFRNLNIKTCSNAELIDLRSQTLPAFNLHIQATQELVRRCNNDKKTTAQEETHKPQIIAIANGRKLSEEERSNINEDEFDIILDLTTRSLRYRSYPDKHSRLEESILEGIGPRRIEILSYLLEHPTRNISVENVSAISSQMDIVSSNTLSKTISLLRKALGQIEPRGPYIITERSLGSVHHTYKINCQWKYLVIRKKTEVTGKSEAWE